MAPSLRSAYVTRAELPAPAEAGDCVTPVQEPSVTRFALPPDMVCDPLQMLVVLPVSWATSVRFRVMSP